MYLLILLCTITMLEIAINMLELETVCVCVCVSELMGKDFIYTRVLFSCVLVDLTLYHLYA